jgi:hypothetical protein
MKSLPAALTWELLHRGRWALPAAALASLAFPVLILAALAQDGALFLQDESLVILQLVLVQFNIFMFAAMGLSHAWRLDSLYTYPATSAALVTWRLLPAMALLAAETVAWTAALNGIFRLHWPLWGPAAFAAAAVPAVCAVTWLTYRSRWMIVGLAVVGSALGLWLRLRYGAFSAPQLHVWSTLTPIETLTLAAMAIVSWRVAIAGVARNRRGEPPFSLGIVAWFDRVLDRAATGPRPFRSPAAAQYWYASRHGQLASAVFLMFVVVCLVVWMFVSRDPRDLVEGALCLAPILGGTGVVVGAALGNVSPRNDLIMGQFLATRPMTAADQAWTILRAAAVNLLRAWLLWAVALALAYAVCAGAGASLRLLGPSEWFAMLASILGSWIAAGAMIGVGLTGRGQLGAQVFCAVIAAFIAILLGSKFALPPDVFEQVMRGLGLCAGVACVVGALAAFVAARRRRLIDAATAWAALAAWATLVITGVLMLKPMSRIPLAGYALLVGMLALTVMPLAVAPLALTWNRHR